MNEFLVLTIGAKKNNSQKCHQILILAYQRILIESSVRKLFFFFLSFKLSTLPTAVSYHPLLKNMFVIH